MNSKLATINIYSPCNYGKRTHAIDTITIHCMAAPWSAKTCATYFSHADTKAASNYCIGIDGEIAVSVPEDMAAWCSSNKANDMRAVTIEVASDAKHPYAVTEKSLASLINLCADICKRNGINALVWSNSKADRINHTNGCNMTVHRDYANKACPGDYLMGKMPYIASEVNKLIKSTNTQEDKPMTDYEKEFAKAVELGITDGTNPDGNATRRQVAVMVLRAIKIVFKLLDKVEV